MAKTKNYYYVLVFTDAGPVYVTSVDNRAQLAHWEKDKEPKAFPKYYAEELALGLNLNCYTSVVVMSKHEQYQPYNYEDYDCKFIEKT